jgi:uncharacterized protein (TIGR02145 family)
MKYVVIGICLLEQVLLGTVVSAVCSLDEYTWLPIEWGTLGDSVSYAGDFAVYDGRLIASVNYANTSCIAAWDGNDWTVLGTTNGKVSPLQVYDGKLYVSGYFSAIEGIAMANIAVWDGTSWSGAGGGANGTVISLGLYDGKLFAGGPFTMMGGISALHIAQWNGVTWSRLGSGLNELAHALVEYDGKLIVGGFFTSAGGVPANRVAAWDGSAWSPLGQGIGDEAVLFSTVYNDKVYVSGQFTLAGGNEIKYLAAWDGSSWSSVGSGITGTTPSIVSFCEYNGELLVIGNFDSAGGAPANCIAAWDGASWRPFDSATYWGSDGIVGWNLGLFNNELYAAGYFLDSAGVPTYRIVRWGKPIFEAGDANGDGAANVGDAVFLINFVFKGGPAPERLEAGDANYDGQTNVGDAVYLINYVFKGGPAPNCPMTVPTVTTSDVGELTQTTAQCGGTITSDGGATITARGVCWSTDPTPTVADGRTIDGTGTGSFTSSITGLAAKTTYYVTAYATNGIGTGYGNIRSFTTTDSVGTVTDIDGNTYRTVKIGNQWWMAENLKVTHYRNGDPLPNVTDGATWRGLTTGAYCEYDNDVNSVATYGRLYNWYAVADIRNIAPPGWHVASDAEWKQLERYLGMSQAEADQTGWRGTDEGGKLKEGGTSHWISPNTGATNESGFTGLPGGYRYLGGLYYDIGVHAVFWSSTENGSSFAWCRNLGNAYSGVHRYDGGKEDGFSVRCVKD